MSPYKSWVRGAAAIDSPHVATNLPSGSGEAAAQQDADKLTHYLAVDPCRIGGEMHERVVALLWII